MEQYEEAKYIYRNQEKIHFLWGVIFSNVSQEKERNTMWISSHLIAIIVSKKSELFLFCISDKQY